MILFEMELKRMQMECYYMKTDKPKKVKQLKAKAPRDYPLEPPPDYFSLDGLKFNWPLVIWVAVILMAAWGLVAWALSMAPNNMTAEAISDKQIVQLPIKDAA